MMCDTIDTSSGDDTRKKRDSAQVEEAKEEEKAKKVCVHQSSSTRNLSPTSSRRLAAPSVGHSESQSKIRAVEANSRAKEASGSSSNNAQVWDLESALQYLVQIDDSDTKEYLAMDDESSWVTFRVGHAGDASTIANWYRQSKHVDEDTPELEKKMEEPEEEAVSSSSMLEVWLADGLGDEDTPPSVHCLLAQVHSVDTISEDCNNKSTTSLGAVALLTLAWTEGERILRVEWMHIDSSLPQPGIASTLEQRLWLRLSSLSIMTACQVLMVDGQLTSGHTTSKVAIAKLPPSAE